MGFQFDTATTLHYSDDPEKLSVADQGTPHGVLIDFDLPVNVRSRFLYYHVNQDGPVRHLTVRAKNITAEPCVLRVSSTLPNPSADYFAVGHASSARFMARLIKNAWQSMTIPPGASAVVAATDLANLELASGIMELELTSGQSLRFAVIVSSGPGDVEAVADNGFRLPFDAHHRRGRFDVSAKNDIELKYVVGGPNVAVRLGTRTFVNELKDAMPYGADYVGEYGLFRSVTIDMSNDTLADVKVSVYQAAHGGPSTATYYIDGAFVQSGAMQTGTGGNYPQYKICTTTVPAQGTATTHLVTIPDNASSSPVVLTVAPSDASPDVGDPGSIVANAFP